MLTDAQKRAVKLIKRHGGEIHMNYIDRWWLPGCWYMNTATINALFKKGYLEYQQKTNRHIARLVKEV
jgi:ribosomal protein S2